MYKRQSQGLNVTLTQENYQKVLAQAQAAKPEAAQQLAAMEAQITQVIQFCNGVLTYTGGVDSAAAGALQLLSLIHIFSDEHKTPREMLCYIINTTSAPVCLIIPISAWVVFFSGVFEQQPEAAAAGDSAMDIYYHIMPYFFYPFLCVIFVLLVILGVVPKMGGIKKAYKRVAETGQLWPESSNTQNQGNELGEVMGAAGGQSAKEEKEITPHLWTCLLYTSHCLAETKKELLWMPGVRKAY